MYFYKNNWYKKNKQGMWMIGCYGNTKSKTAKTWFRYTGQSDFMKKVMKDGDCLHEL